MSQKRIVQLTKRFEELMARSGVYLDDGMSNDLKTIMKEEEKSVLEQYPKNCFLYLCLAAPKGTPFEESKRNEVASSDDSLYLHHQSNKVV